MGKERSYCTQCGKKQYRIKMYLYWVQILKKKAWVCSACDYRLRASDSLNPRLMSDK